MVLANYSYSRIPSKPAAMEWPAIDHLEKENVRLQVNLKSVDVLQIFQQQSANLLKQSLNLNYRPYSIIQSLLE